MAIISINKLCFRYDQREVLHDISLSIEQGMFVAIVGPNGGGKTTLLKLILGLLEPRFGSVRVFDRNPKDARCDIGYVPQFILFDTHFPASVLDVVLMGRVERRVIGRYTSEDRAVAQECLESVGLGDYSNRPFSALSGGERQRVLIAQALATEPKLLLLDEPCANLDPIASKQLFDLLKTLNEKLTVVMVSHNLEVVSTFVSHVICVNRTAEMHDIHELHCDPITGTWMHISHGACPVADHYAQGTCRHDEQ